MGMSFKQLVVWQRAVELSLATYKLTSGFPKSEQFGLTNQLRRAAVSIASNIAEGTAVPRQGNICSFSDTRVVRFLNCKHNLLSRRPCNSGLKTP
jgi:23S rRNA-intervening sequence protein